jgi:hypothetical protein
VPAIDRLARYVPGWGRDQVGECADLLWRCDVVLDACEQEDRTIGDRQVHLPPVDDEHGASQFVVDEQVLSDPELDGSGQILCPFEPVGEVDVPSHVVGIVDVGEKARQALDRSAGFQQREPG